MALEQKSDITSEHQVSIIGFVWRPEEITPALLQMAQQTGSRAVFDFSLMGLDELGSFLRKADLAGQVRNIKISAPAFLDPSLGQVFKETGVQDIWVEYHAPLFHGDPAIFLQRLRELSENHRCFPITGDLEILSEIVKETSGIGRIVLKGCEAAGFVSSETTTALYATVKEKLARSPKSLDILVWGGVFTPEAAAAFLSTGASGIVFESVHWLTDLVAIDDVQRQRISKLRLDATELIGVNLQVPCRLFNKGNSLAFKEIKTFEDSLYKAASREESRCSFASQVQVRAIHPLESHFGQDEVIPLGVEAAFAASFVQRFGTGTVAAVAAFMDEIRTACRLAETKKGCFLDSPVAGEMGTLYPFVQGGMSWITDVPEFAARVADVGGLPTIALGMMDAETLDQRLGCLPEIMAGRPYALNFISLAENPCREMHLAWIKKLRPHFVVIAGGDLSPIKELLECGLEVIYIAPDEALLRLALEGGVKYVVCEGYEAGGHVGKQSTLTLAQMVLDLKRRSPDLFRNCRMILAGGIFNRETAFMAAMLGADAIQMGTAYLTTPEIVETGTLTPLYQRMILNSPPGGTVVSGQHTGLRVRSLSTPRVEAILSLEREYAAGQQDEASFRTKVEEMAAGSLFAAARGKGRPGDVPLDEQTCLERGQFMSGACAGLIGEVRDLRSFHQELAAGPLVLHQPLVGEIGTSAEPSLDASLQRETPSSGAGTGARIIAPQEDTHERIAITGMSILNSLGSSPEEIWAASLAMKSGITLVPPSRWDHSIFYDSRPHVLDKTYCKVGAFLDFPISRSDLGIPPQDFRTMTEATKLTLWLADKAIRASGILESDIPRERIGVIISQNSGEAAGTLTSIIIRAYAHDILTAVNRAVNLTPEQVSAVEREVKAGRMAPDDTTLLGRLNCAAPGFICNRYGFMGPSFAVSAACSTSLVALHSAIQMIRNGIIDAAIVGGGEDNLTHLHFLEFAAVGALYGLSGRERPPYETSRPFDAERDGMVLGEGGGMIVIERESLARARGARIDAIITGMGASNNTLGMVESNSASQELAIRTSFKDLPYGPEAVDLVECHATSTRQGDVEEVRALKAFFKPSKRTVLSSFKSQIGHTLGASGISNLIRGAMAMKAGVFPATLNYHHPDPEMELEGSGLLIPTEPLDWKVRDGQPRRLQVNAFGFGGSNYVVHVEQAMDQADSVMVSPSLSSRLAGEKKESTPAIKGVSFFRTELGGRSHRLAVVAQSDDEALTVIGRSAALAEAGTGSPKALRALAQQGIFVGRDDLPLPPLALLFPGQGAQYEGMGRDLYESFPVIREWIDRAAAAADFDLLHLLFHDQGEELLKTRWQQPALFALEHAMARYLISLGIEPVAMAGHSLGELTALCLAGVYSVEDGFRIVNERARCMDEVAVGNIDPGVMAAVDAPLELLKELLQGRKNLYIGNINSPNQIVLSGGSEAVKKLGAELKEQGYRSTLLRVSMAFHSPIMSVIHDELDAFVATIPFHPPQIPVLSNTTRELYPSDPVEIRRILMAHLESTVHWMSNLQTLRDDHGVRLFVEVGPGDVLSNLTADTLPDATCLQTCLPTEEGLTYRAALAQLYVQGHLKVNGEPRYVSLSGSGKAAEPRRISPAPALRPSEPGFAGTNPVERIIQREVNRFVMETFGQLLKPSILQAIRQEHNPAFQEGDLSDVIKAMLAGSGLPEGQKQVLHGKPAFPPLDSTTAIPVPASPAASRMPEGPDLLERLIRIIMDATGYEREEIQPDMDLRKDLAIRSSRMPIIMDAAESQFGIIIELEDFIDARTVRDIAGRITAIIARQGGAEPQQVSSALDLANQTSPVTAGVPEGRDLLERLIQIIMDATGYEREEIQPDMDLRKDLAIRSSRMPIIMDAAESQFGIIIELEDFIDARTVRDIAGRITAIIARQGGAEPQQESDPVQDGILKSSRNDESLKRIVFNQVTLECLAAVPLALNRGETVLLLSPDSDDRIVGSAKEIFRRDYGVETFLLPFMQENFTPGAEGLDILTDEGAGRAAEILSGLESLAGMVITLPHGGSEKLSSMADVSRCLRGLFLLVKTFLRSPRKKFLVLIHSRDDSETPGRLLTEGLLGLFLSAAQEYPSVQFRTVGIERGADLHNTLRNALDRGCTVVETVQRDGKLFTTEGQIAPSLFGNASGLTLSPGDVIVMSGGATGISAHLASSLVPFMPRLVFLGRTSPDSGTDRAAEIARNLTKLHSAGVEATYYTCDVSDPVAVRTIMGEVANRYGRIDGVIHGAGVLRDGLLHQMSQDDFSTVTDIKFLGAWNLFSAAEGAGLRFFVGLSSAAAIQGNPGQANYAAANRMMSALLGTLRRKNQAILFKALMLPPIEGAGMADDPEIRELLKLKGVGYIHAQELAGLFCRELFASPADDVWVMFMRKLPSLKTALLNDRDRPSFSGELDAGTVSLRPEDFPLIERITSLDIRREELEAFRTFSLEKDLWIEDHKPFTFITHPLVSAAMVLETLMEAARIMYPHLQVRGVRQVKLMDMIQCPPNVPRPCRISCCRAGNGPGEVVCEVSIAAEEITPAGRLTDRFSPHYKGQVILAGGEGCLGEGFMDFPVRSDELRTKPMDYKKVRTWYEERSGLEGRYRVIESLDGAGPGVVRGRTTYRLTADFAHLQNARYHYSVYLFEALLQLVGFQLAASDPAERRSLIPLEIGEMRFLRKCRAGEQLTLEARLRQQDEEGLTWDARALDDQGIAIMQVSGMRMHWVTE